MKKFILFFSFISVCFWPSAAKQICVSNSSSGSGTGTPSNPYRTIQEAVDDAAISGDTIKVAQGTYLEAVKILQKKVQLLGGFAGGGDFNSANPQTYKTTIKGTSAAAPCIFVDIDQVIPGSLTISGFTICDGKRGIELQGGWSGRLDNITIENNIIENNGTTDIDQRGGGIGLEGVNVTVKNNILRNNKSGRGAAIGRTSTLVNFLIADNLIENNKGHHEHAGGVLVDGTGTVTRNIFDGNITNASNTYTYGYGGAIMVTNYDTTKLVTLSHNVYRNNSATLTGGAVFVDEAAKVRMDHELLYNNKCEKNGSAIYVDADQDCNPSVLYMSNCTVSGNSTTDTDETSALFVQGSHAYVENCIFWNNGSDFRAIDEENDEHQPVPAILTVKYTLTQQGFAGTGNISSNPLFANPSGGDFHLQSTAGRFDPLTKQFVVIDHANSPAIDAGNPSSNFSNEPSPNGGRINLGCYGNTAEASKSAFTGIEENTQFLWTVFPNPAKESIIIDHLPSGASINIIDIMGKTVYSSEIENEQTIINVANFENGIYIIQVTINGVVTNRKLVVSK